MRYLARSALGTLCLRLGIMGEGRPKNLRRGYFTRKSGIPRLLVNSLERTLFFNLRPVKLAWRIEGG
jgi:hypothetical protein